MPAVFVHGNPETPVVWEPLLSALGREDVVTLQLPGFGCTSPAGWGATKEDYAAWLIDEVETLGAADGPIDLVGHDWGGVLSLYCVAKRTDLIATWVCDALGIFHEDYVWHDFAQIWQTEGAGEEYFKAMLASSDSDLAAVLVSVGIPEPTASKLAAAQDEEMATCVLALYRSAVQPAMVEWGSQAGAAAERPGLFIHATEDPFASPALAPVVAERLKMRTATLQGHGHWWMLTAPEEGAEALREFWATGTE